MFPEVERMFPKMDRMFHNVDQRFPEALERITERTSTECVLVRVRGFGMDRKRTITVDLDRFTIFSSLHQIKAAAFHSPLVHKAFPNKRGAGKELSHRQNAPVVRIMMPP
jgi:hypothetical protein